MPGPKVKSKEHRKALERHREAVVAALLPIREKQADIKMNLVMMTSGYGNDIAMEHAMIRSETWRRDDDTW